MIKPLKFLYGNHGEHGDILIGLPGARHLFQKTGAQITFCVNRKFHKIAPFLRGLPYLSGVYISDSYEQFPSAIDSNYLAYMGFDHVFNPMQGHTRWDWYNHFHYTEELAMGHGVLTAGELLGFHRKIGLVKFWGEKKIPDRTIAFSPYANGRDRALSTEDAQFMVDVLRREGFTVLMLGIEKDLNGVTYLEDNSLLNAGIHLAEAAGVVTVDTVWSWLASGYSKKTFGLFSVNYPDMVKQWSHLPSNPNGTYLVNPNIKKLDREKIEFELVKWAKSL
jgi:hypothetical protein